MMVISVPTRLRVASTTLFLCIPLIAIEVMIATRSPYWRLPIRNMGYWSLSFALITIPLASWLSAAKRWAFQLTTCLGGTWILASAWMSIAMKYPPLGFFTIFLLGFFVLEMSWLKHELKKSFIDPQLRWYQSMPKPIPGLRCKLASGEKSIDLRVSRMDQDGVFLYTPSMESKSLSILSNLMEKRKLELILNFGDQRVTCEGRPIVTINKGSGVGIQFKNSSSDLKKDVGDFVEVLRGQGYV